MPGETFDEKSARLSREAAAEAERDRAYREQAGREAAIAWERLKAILRGERPTRESNADWFARQQRGMLPGIVNPAFPSQGMLPTAPPRPGSETVPLFVRG